MVPETGKTEARMERIARRAREIYEARKDGQDRALEDWLQAEREIDAQIEAEQRQRDRESR
jgi:hypothetical protein